MSHRLAISRHVYSRWKIKQRGFGEHHVEDMSQKPTGIKLLIGHGSITVNRLAPATWLDRALYSIISRLPPFSVPKLYTYIKSLVIEYNP